MNRKELFKSFWLTIGTVLFSILFIKSLYDWTQGKQPDNFTVMTILLMAIVLQSMFNAWLKE